MYYASLFRWWHPIMILVRTDHPCLGVGCHTARSPESIAPPTPIATDAAHPNLWARHAAASGFDMLSPWTPSSCRHIDCNLIVYIPPPAASATTFEPLTPPTHGDPESRCCCNCLRLPVHGSTSPPARIDLQLQCFQWVVAIFTFCQLQRHFNSIVVIICLRLKWFQQTDTMSANASVATWLTLI
jgi:hypothetical protein